MVLELACDGAFDSPVAGIVDARGHFVCKKRALVFEKFDGEHADILQGFENAAGGGFRDGRNGGLEARGGGEREAEDAVAVVVFHERVNGGFAIARADRKDGEFASEGDETLEDQFYGRQLGPGFRDVLRGAKSPLAFAVITHARCFQDGGKAERFYGGVEFAGIRNGGEFGGGDAEFAEEILFGEAVLRGFESGGGEGGGGGAGRRRRGVPGGG